MKAQKGWAILQFEKGDSHTTTAFGLLVPTQRTQAQMVKGKTRIISTDPDANIPDVIRIGTIISHPSLKAGTSVIFNRHDAFGFELDEKTYYAIKEELIIATL